MSILRWILVAFALTGCSVIPDPQGNPGPPVQAWSSTGWSDRSLPGKRHTRYTAHWRDGRSVIQAESEASASMYRRAVRFEPGKLGKLRFSWRTEDLIRTASLIDREAADSPVRLLLAFDGDHARLSLQNRLMFDLAHAVSGEMPPYATLMYVWDNHAPMETVIPGGRSDRIRKIVLETGSRNVGKWRHYERDIAADFRRAFGEEPGSLVSIAFMTDSDNTRSSARAWYGEVSLCAQGGMVC